MKSAGLILCAKPEDAADVHRVFHNAKRLDDLVIFDAEGKMRCNFLNCMKRPRDAVTLLTTFSETLKRGDSKGGGDSSRFYDAQEDRTIYHAVTALRAANEPLIGINIHRFITTAATTSAELLTREWQAKYHSKVLEKGFDAKKTPMESHDYELCQDFWITEWPSVMDHKTRGNILAGVQGTLHTLNSGIVREMCSGETNCSPADVLAGKWVLVNFPPSTWGASGLLISVGWKLLVQLAVLERHATDKDPFVTIWCDEAHQFVVPGSDSAFLAQCRSHMGCLFCLTQSTSSFYAAMKGEGGKHQADALLANFSHVIVHACDPVSAKWAASKLGRRKEILYSGSSSPSHNASIWDQINGRQQTSASFSEHYENVLQEQEFMIGRTGGPANGLIADSVVIRSGEPFANGQNYLRVPWSQRG